MVFIAVVLRIDTLTSAVNIAFCNASIVPTEWTGRGFNIMLCVSISDRCWIFMTRIGHAHSVRDFLLLQARKANVNLSHRSKQYLIAREIPACRLLLNWILSYTTFCIVIFHTVQSRRVAGRNHARILRFPLKFQHWALRLLSPLANYTSPRVFECRVSGERWFCVMEDRQKSTACFSFQPGPSAWCFSGAEIDRQEFCSGQVLTLTESFAITLWQ